jgi:hypothetical protein
MYKLTFEEYEAMLKRDAETASEKRLRECVAAIDELNAFRDQGEVQYVPQCRQCKDTGIPVASNGLCSRCGGGL